MLRRFGLQVLLVSFGLALAGAARADTVRIDWYSVSPTFPDFNLPPCGTQDCGQNFSNEVASTLSGGLPVVSAANPANLAEGAGNVLQWWTPQPGVTYEGFTYQSLPIGQSMFVPMGTGNNDSGAFQTAIISGNLHVTTSATITYGGDDDMFLALDGNVVSQVGGIHPTGVSANYVVGPGDYFMQVFYADRHVTAAYANLDVRGGSFTGAVPEPSTWAMIFIGFLGLGFLGYRRRSTSNLRLV